MPSVTLPAPAKVNLTLEVLGRRADGYHDIRSVMQAITLADSLSVAPADELTVRCSLAELEGPHNLVWRAAALLRRETGTRSGATIDLEKHIPVAAGLGGGSSDAATTLLALNALWGLGLSRCDLRRLGAQLGSDVPFFLGESACALAEGRGERLTPLPALPLRWLVLVKPGLAVSTAAVYGAFPPARWSDGQRTTAWLLASAGGAHVPAPFDDLEPVTLDLVAGAAAGRAALLAAGAAGAVLSGSGPTFFALFAAERAARVVFDRLRPGPPSTAPGAQEVCLARFGSLAG